jgi:hypothetical protein
MERRALLHWLVATGGLAAVHRLSAQDLGALGTSAHARLTSDAPAAGLLSPAERRTVEVAAECIIPRTETPGATDARVADFIDLMLAEWYPAADAARFRAGLVTIDATSRSRFGLVFVEAAPAQQVALMQALDDELTARRRTAGRAANEHWFAMLKYLTVWGFCTSEPAMRDVLHVLPRPMRYDGAAPVR